VLQTNAAALMIALRQKGINQAVSDAQKPCWLGVIANPGSAWQQVRVILD
jgi:hypothetical protein